MKLRWSCWGSSVRNPPARSKKPEARRRTCLWKEAPFFFEGRDARRDAVVATTWTRSGQPASRRRSPAARSCAELRGRGAGGARGRRREESAGGGSGESFSFSLSKGSCTRSLHTRVSSALLSRRGLTGAATPEGRYWPGTLRGAKGTRRGFARRVAEDNNQLQRMPSASFYSCSCRGTR